MALLNSSFNSAKLHNQKNDDHLRQDAVHVALTLITISTISQLYRHRHRTQYLQGRSRLRPLCSRGTRKFGDFLQVL